MSESWWFESKALEFPARFGSHSDDVSLSVNSPQRH